MIDTLAAEWIKLRTVLVHWVLVTIAIAFPVIVVTLVAIFADFEIAVASTDAADVIVALSIVSAMLLGTTVAISLTGEYTHNTIRPTYAATPHRLRVIGAKLTLSSIVAVAVSACTVVACWIVLAGVLSSRDRSISLGDDRVLAALVSVVALALLVSWLGFGLGLIIRNSPATVSVLLLWPLLIEGLVALLLDLVGLDGVGRYLPYGAALSTVSTEVDDDSLGRPGGLLLFGAVGLALVALGAFLDHRRDA